jgi:hypothetical protein
MHPLKNFGPKVSGKMTGWGRQTDRLAHTSFSPKLLSACIGSILLDDGNICIVLSGGMKALSASSSDSTRASKPLIGNIFWLHCVEGVGGINDAHILGLVYKAHMPLPQC